MILDTAITKSKEMKYTFKATGFIFSSLVLLGNSLINPLMANGATARLGIIETSDEPRPRMNPLVPQGTYIGINGNLGERVKEQYNFGEQVPIVPPNFPKLPAGTISNPHSTNVANIAIQNNMADIFFGGLGTSAYVTGTGDTPTIYNAFRSATDWLYRNKGVGLFNLSDWIEGDPPQETGASSGINKNGANNSAKFIDWFSKTNDVLLIKSAGNNGQATGLATNQISNPGDAYNVITVGANDSSHTRAPYSSYWLSGDNGTQPDVRGKPDILAPGDFNGEQGTSFATPHVAAASALLWEKGLELGTQGKNNHLAHKAIILNSADKRRINPPNNNGNLQQVSNDLTKTASDVSDQDYLGSGTTEKWTPTKWQKEGQRLIVDKPLDDEQGTGILDLTRVVTQYEGGKQSPGTVTQIGWDIGTLANGESLYTLDFPINADTFITTTLNWDRNISCTRLSIACDNTVTLDDQYEFLDLPDLDLFILFKDEIVAESISSNENVEHLHYLVPEKANAGDYKIQVKVPFSTNTSPLIPYGLAWWTQLRDESTPIPEPSSTVTVLAFGILGMSLMIKRQF